MKLSSLILALISALSLALGGGLVPSLAQADKEPAGFRNVLLWLNPEYDDPRLLVMLQGKLTGAEAPAKVRFLVPRAAEMYSAGSIDAQGKYTGGPPERKPSDVPGWDEISYEVKTDTFRMEYYDPVIATDPAKRISYDFRPLYPVSDLKVVVQEPRQSTGFSATPDGVSGVDSEGFTVHSSNFTNVVPGSALHFDIAYTRTDPNPSLGDNDTAVSTAASPPSVPLVIGILAAIGAGVAIFFQFRGPRQKRQPVKYSRNDKVKHGSVRRFCARCGNAVGSSDRFCAGCGERLHA